jgi:hypothetical protein
VLRDDDLSKIGRRPPYRSVFYGGLDLGRPPLRLPLHPYMLIARDLAQSLDPALFARDCGVTPDPWQADLLRTKPRRALLNCARQTGKTTTTGLLALDVAVHEPGSLIPIISPSQWQSAEMLRTVRALHNRLDSAPALAAESCHARWSLGPKAEASRIGSPIERKRPKGGHRSLRDISAELAQRGHLIGRDQPFSAAAINSIFARQRMF